MNSIKDTITAITTPLGTGGVGVIRLSGEKAFEIISCIFSSSLKEKVIPDFKPNRIYHGWIIDENTPVDEVILLIFKAPNSYTGENIIEIQCHGGLNIVKQILEICLKSGARLAEKGEFTKRAFLNGKMDLSQAEAVLDLIHSKTRKFAQVSASNLSGKLRLFINDLRSELIGLLSIINAAIDFPEEVNEPEYSLIEDKITDCIEKIDKILKSAQSSNLMRQGMKVAIAGKPNVGKSSLFNVLLDLERSIVTDIPGTTRDVIQESLDIGGIPVTLIDTAGIRESGEDQVEKIGINIAKSYIQEANIVLFVYSSIEGIKEEDQAILNEIQDKEIIKIASKADIAKSIPQNALGVSSKTLQGIDRLKQELENRIFSKDTMIDGEFATNIRQQECMLNAKTSLIQAHTSSKNKEAQDFISIDLKSALISLGEITGEVITDEILENIFSSFCIGK